MPIRIDDEKNNRSDIVFLCDDEWTISPQLYELDRWLKEAGKKLEPGEYVADIGIHSIDPSATGGGGVLSVDAIRIMGTIGMGLWISEYGENHCKGP